MGPNPITQSDPFYLKQKNLARRPLITKYHNVNPYKTSRDEIYQRKKKAEIEIKKIDDTNWKSSAKLVPEYTNKVRQDDTNIKRGLKRINASNFGRDPIIQSTETVPIINKRKEYQPSNIYKSFNNKGVIEYSQKKNILKNSYEAFNNARNLMNDNPLSISLRDTFATMKSGRKCKEVLQNTAFGYKGIPKTEKPNNLKYNFEEIHSQNLYNVYNKKSIIIRK